MTSQIKRMGSLLSEVQAKLGEIHEAILEKGIFDKESIRKINESLEQKEEKQKEYEEGKGKNEGMEQIKEGETEEKGSLVETNSKEIEDGENRIMGKEVEGETTKNEEEELAKETTKIIKSQELRKEAGRETDDKELAKEAPREINSQEAVKINDAEGQREASHKKNESQPKMGPEKQERSSNQDGDNGEISQNGNMMASLKEPKAKTRDQRRQSGKLQKEPITLKKKLVPNLEESSKQSASLPSLSKEKDNQILPPVKTFKKFISPSFSLISLSSQDNPKLKEAVQVHQIQSLQLL